MTDHVTLQIDGKEVSVPKGTLVVDAAAQVHIEIPVFCSHPKLDPVGCCRMCLVEFESPRGVMMNTACTMPVAEGMIVRTQTEQVKAAQEANLGFILLNHPLDCPICDKGGECPLQDQTMRFGPGASQLVEAKHHAKKHYHISDTIVLDQERCVVCWRCVRYLEEWEDKPQLGLFERGGKTIIDIQPGQPVDAKTGGNIIDICPVGALTNQVSRFHYRPWQIERIPTISLHDSMGSNIRVDTRSNEIRRIAGRENMAVNDQWISDKDRFSYAWVNHPDRLTKPLVRKNGQLAEATWEEALAAVTAGLKKIHAQHGPQAVGAIGSAKVSNEGNYLLQRFVRESLGSNNIDHRNGGDVAALPTGLPAIADLMKPQYGPNPKVDVIFLFGIDPSEELPLLDLHLKRAVRRGKVKLIIAHPRQVELTRYDGPYLGYRPGSEVTLINGMIKAALALVEDGPTNLTNWVAEISDQQLIDLCGVDPAAVEAAAHLLHTSENAQVIFGPLATGGEEGQEVLNALINLTLATGHYQRLAYVGLDANSQGCRDMGVLPTALPGHSGLEDAEARTRLEKLWQCKVPTQPGLTYKQMLEGAGDAIQALYILGADPASERPTWSANLDQLDFLVVQDLFLTESAALADVVLPAVSWVEGDGTFTNLERRVQRAPKALTLHESQAAPDWLILDHLSHHFGADWRYQSAQDVTAELGKAAPIYQGITWESIGDQGLQWDASAVRPRGAYRKVTQHPLPVTTDYPLILVSGTVCYDGGSLFALTEQMQKMAAQPFVGLNPQDAAERQLKAGETATIISPQGALSAPVKIDGQVQPGTVWLPESLAQTPVGALLNGARVQAVQVSKA